MIGSMEFQLWKWATILMKSKCFARQVLNDLWKKKKLMKTRCELSSSVSKKKRKKLKKAKIYESLFYEAIGLIILRERLASFLSNGSFQQQPGNCPRCCVMMTIYWIYRIGIYLWFSQQQHDGQLLEYHVDYLRSLESELTHLLTNWKMKKPVDLIITNVNIVCCDNDVSYK